MVSYWTDLLREIWQIDGDLTQLDGEYDLNFSVEGDVPAILKVMRVGCDEGFIDLQTSALQYLSEHTASIPVPKVIPSIKGEL